MGFATEFKEFALKGNVMDLAVGVIIGGAFGKIVDSVVSDLIMPLIGVASMRSRSAWSTAWRMASSIARTSMSWRMRGGVGN